MGGSKKDIDERIRRKYMSTDSRFFEALNKSVPNGDIFGCGEGDIEDVGVDVSLDVASEFPLQKLAVKAAATSSDIEMSVNPMRSPCRHPMADKNGNVGPAAVAVASSLSAHKDLEAMVIDVESAGDTGPFSSESRLGVRPSLKLGWNPEAKKGHRQSKI
jgi:hypothetical protein